MSEIMRTASLTLDLLGRLQRHLTFVLIPVAEALVQHLFEDMSRALDDRGSVESWGAIRDSRESLAMHRARFAPSFTGELMHRIQALPEGSTLATFAPAPTRGLELACDESLEEDGVLIAIARRHEARTSLPLLLLGHRLGVLLGGPELQAGKHPLGPDAFCAAIAHAAREVGLCGYSRAMLYRRFDNTFMASYPDWIESVNALLEGANILPGLQFIPLGNRPLADAQREETSPSILASATTGTLPDLDVIRLVNETLAAAWRDAPLPQRATLRHEWGIVLSRVLVRWGPKSAQWRTALEVGAIVARSPASRLSDTGLTHRLNELLGEAGYMEEDAMRLALRFVASTATLHRAPSPDILPHASDWLEPATLEPSPGTPLARPVPSTKAPSVAYVDATVRIGLEDKQAARLYDQLCGAKPGTVFWFRESGGGATRAVLRNHYLGPRRLQLAREDGATVLVDVGVLTRQVLDAEARLHSPDRRWNKQGGAKPSWRRLYRLIGRRGRV